MSVTSAFRCRMRRLRTTPSLTIWRGNTQSSTVRDHRAICGFWELGTQVKAGKKVRYLSPSAPIQAKPWAIGRYRKARRCARLHLPAAYPGVNGDQKKASQSGLAAVSGCGRTNVDRPLFPVVIAPCCRHRNCPGFFRNACPTYAMVAASNCACCSSGARRTRSTRLSAIRAVISARSNFSGPSTCS